MKKLKLMSMLVFVPIVVGVLLLVMGSVTENAAMEYVGIAFLQYGIPAVMFTLVVVGLILLITGRIDLNDEKKEKKKSDTAHDSDPDGSDAPMSGKEREEAEIAEVNSSYGYESKMSKGAYEARHAAENYKNATTGDKIKGWLFFGFLMTDFALILVFIFLRITLGALICFCLFGGTIFISLIVKLILERTSKHFNPDKAKEILEGTVKACLLSSSTSVGGAKRHSTTRITGVTYRVVVSVRDREYTAYTDNYYEKGETVTIAVMGGKRASIIDK